MPKATASEALERNRCTYLVGLDRPTDAPFGPHEAFLIAHERLRMLASIAPKGALVIAAVSPAARVLEALLIPDRTAVIVGRHAQCGLRLPLDPVSLRHVAVLARAERGRSVAHVWDLNTHMPFLTEDGQRNCAIVVDGPACVSVGQYALWIVPAQSAANWPSGAVHAWRALPARQFVDRRAPLRPLPARPIAARPDRRASAITRVTSIGPPLLLGDGEAPEVGWGTLCLEVAGQRQRRHVSAERLAHGIIVGRYDRCGMVVAQCQQLSRVHVLLVRIADELWAIDTGSTNGVLRAGLTVAAEVLADEDTLTLSSDIKIQWRRDKHAQA